MNSSAPIARLLARFYDPNEGQVLLDGVDLRQLSEVDLRRSVVLVTQENFLFTGSVANNIGLGRPTAPRAEIEAAAEGLPPNRTVDRRHQGGPLTSIGDGRAALPASGMSTITGAPGRRFV